MFASVLSARRIVRLLWSTLLLSPVIFMNAQASCDWPEWQHFKQHYMTDQGRVIDPSNDNITTSEGQSYALFFALVANDQTAFEQLTHWTENNLAQGDLTAHLPGWLWGKNDKGNWTILDKNSASDSDLWIAYTLEEAGRLWNNRRYQVLGALLRQRIVHEEVTDAKGLGKVLLPGKRGFVADQGWKLNPSYTPPHIIARFAQQGEPWAAIQKSNLRLLIESAPKGFAPNWIIWQKTGDWADDSHSRGIGSYDAIRVYLWIGMLPDSDPQKQTLLAHFKPMADRVAELGVPPENVTTTNGESEGGGPVGFSAALLPFLANSPLLAEQRKRVTEHESTADAYYTSVLILFGRGWDEGRYRFNAKGELLPNWSDKCDVSR